MSFLLSAYLLVGVVLLGYWRRLERRRAALLARVEDRGERATPPGP
ncbi:MAG: hypothetical protein V3T14_10320 [Myxococcota bacterium]